MKINILLQNYKKSLLLGVIILCFGHSALAQRVAISTDVIDWATASINAGVELRVSSRITVGFDIVCNPFPKMPFFSDLRLTNTRIEPNINYWFNRPMAKHSVGAKMIMGNFRVDYNHYCYDGDLIGATVFYGYTLVLSKHWNLGFNAGIGIGRFRGFKYKEGRNRALRPNYSKTLPLPEADVKFSYIF